ncbi:ClbS/DfsB family four-helix bundle protein [Empedobacter tilapiae]|uniref:ClbS/DfsB family four-helix bundle protein n=1 Tax=Empedobacter tilapiae TaxID=2491114 RepID=A0A4Z1C429_9FLAO|nr:ClbS/DfsB family four-helix bundle protein [Empedobacter tilapiae]TGN29852.1 ClbS/DfsB family four-helix bundle protein [Empedobacter tilapiae]
MARPTTKEELLHLSQANYKKLNDLIESISDPNKEFPEGTMNRNIRDVLAHLHHWHLMMLNWYEVGMKGEKPEMPAKGYSWKDTPELNKEIWKKYQKVDFNETKSLFNNSYQDIQKIIEKHTNEELFEKKKYKWTGTTSLGSYLISATSSHYDWAIKLIKKTLK